MEALVTTGAVRRAKLQSYCHQQKTNTQFFIFYRPDALPQLPVAQLKTSVKALKGKRITFHGLTHRKFTWGLLTLSLTSRGSWLPWRRVVKPLISPLTPVAYRRTKAENEI